MTRPEALKYLFDIAEACGKLRQFTAGKSIKDYDADVLLQSAVERQLAIVGEALNNALRVSPGLAAVISDTKRIIAFRNRLIHGYTSVSNAVVWGVLESNLAVLHREVAAVIKSAPPV